MNNNHRLCLAEDGRTQYKIVIPEGASETLKSVSYTHLTLPTKLEV